MQAGSGPGVAVVYHLDDHFAAQAMITSFTTQLYQEEKHKVAGEYYTIGGVYYPVAVVKVQPFLALDFGFSHFNRAKAGSPETQGLLDLGAGLVYFWRHNILLRGELIDYQAVTGGGENDWGASGGFAVLLGQADNEDEVVDDDADD